MDIRKRCIPSKSPEKTWYRIPFVMRICTGIISCLGLLNLGPEVQGRLFYSGAENGGFLNFPSFVPLVIS